ncbi:OsmC family protein [Haloferax namakaokahaiae]|uniref:OsmC family protein n=1 Tax=Haloferax namakaokahaiae TaxID=1748331 RepID=A0ABD5ZHU5_9EURY
MSAEDRTQDSRSNLATYAVSATAESPMRTRVSTRGFEFVIDEPENFGGTDEGPNPLEYLLGALTGCLTITGHLVAREMGLDVNGLEINVEGDLNPAKFMGASDDARAGYQVVRVEFVADIDADEETIESWIAATEERCPVTDNMNHDTPFEFAFVSSS